MRKGLNPSYLNFISLHNINLTMSMQLKQNLIKDVINILVCYLVPNAVDMCHFWAVKRVSLDIIS